MSKSLTRIYIITCLLISGVMSLPLAAQDSLAVQITSVPLTQVPDFSNKTTELVEAIKSILETPEEIVAIQDDLPKSISSIDSMSNRLDGELQTYSLDQLDNQSRRWATLENQIAQWGELLSGRIEQLQDRRHQVEEYVETWDLTLADAREEEAPRELFESIRRDIRLLTNAENDIQKSLNSYLKLQTEIQPLVSRVGEGLKRISEQRDLIMKEIWVPERPPLWEIRSDTLAKPVSVQVKEILADNREAVSNFWGSDPTFKYAVVFIFLLVYINLLYFKSSAKTISNTHPQEIEDARIILRWPLLVSMIVAWFLVAVFFSYPREIARVITLIMITPVAIILYNLSKSHQWHKTLTFIILIGINQLMPLLAGTNLHRNLLMIFALVLMGLLYLVVNWKEYLEEFGDNRRFIIRGALRLFIIVCFASLVANFIGSVRLANMLILGVIGSIIIAIVLYEAISLITDIFSMMMLSSPLNRSNIIKNNRLPIRAGFKRLLAFAVSIWGIYIALNLFGIQDIVIEGLIGFITASMEVGEVSISLGNILAFFLTIQVSIWLSRFIRFFLEEEVFRRTEVSKGIPSTISLIVRYTVISLGVVLAFGAAGIPFDKMALLLGAFGVGIGFGLQNIFNNLVSGLILVVERPFQVGDVVEVGTLMGVVQDIGFRASRVKTYEGADVIVPNGDLISNQMINWTLSDKRRRLEVLVNVPHGSEPDKVLATLKGAAEAHEDILKNPAPLPRFIGFGESSLNFQLLFWIPDFDRSFGLGTEVHLLVHQHLEEAGIKIARPERDIKVQDITALSGKGKKGADK